MTRDRLIIAALAVLLALACWRWHRASQEADAFARLAPALDAARSEAATAQAEVARLKERQRQAEAQAQEAHQAAQEVRERVVERVRVVREREREIVAQPPTEAGALESLARAVAFARVRGLR